MYGVNFDEIKIDDINKFRTFNQFFTREIKDDARFIENEFYQKTLCSPCDGRILSYGTVDSLKSTIDCVKGHNYRLDEFIFGFKGAEIEDPSTKVPTLMETMI